MKVKEKPLAGPIAWVGLEGSGLGLGLGVDAGGTAGDELENASVISDPREAKSAPIPAPSPAPSPLVFSGVTVGLEFDTELILFLLLEEEVKTEGEICGRHTD
jgi:hypothetical protein